MTMTMTAAAANEEEDDDIDSEEEEEGSDFVPSPYSRESLVAIDMEKVVDHCKQRKRAFSAIPSSLSSETKLIAIDEFEDKRWRLPNEGKTLRNSKCTERGCHLFTRF